MWSVKADVGAANEVVDGEDTLGRAVGPYRRGIEYIPGNNLVYQHRHPGPQQICENPAGPITDTVDDFEQPPHDFLIVAPIELKPIGGISYWLIV